MGKLPKFYIWQNGMCITYLLILKKIENYLLFHKWEMTENAEEADYIIIGACASFLPYLDYYQSKINQIKFSKGKKIVYGCIPRIAPDFFCKNANYIDMVIPVTQPYLIESLIEKPDVEWNRFPEATEFRKCDYTNYDPNKKYIAIQEGCNEKCAYCMHRISIGKERSQTMEKIKNTLIQCTKNDTHTIVVLDGENTGGWGLDLTPPQTFKDLIMEITSMPFDFSIHILNLSPKWLMKYGDDVSWILHEKIQEIKIPIQTVSKRMLELVGREPHVLELEPILQEIRNKRQDIVLRTEIIIGLPTETMEELKDTLEFVSRNFNQVACFTFDFYPNTEIASLKDQFLSLENMENHLRFAMDYLSQKKDISSVFDDRGQVCAKVLSSLKNQ